MAPLGNSQTYISRFKICMYLPVRLVWHCLNDFFFRLWTCPPSLFAWTPRSTLTFPWSLPSAVAGHCQFFVRILHRSHPLIPVESPWFLIIWAKTSWTNSTYVLQSLFMFKLGREAFRWICSFFKQSLVFLPVFCLSFSHNSRLNCLIVWLFLSFFIRLLLRSNRKFVLVLMWFRVKPHHKCSKMQEEQVCMYVCTHQRDTQVAICNADQAIFLRVT